MYGNSMAFVWQNRTFNARRLGEVIVDRCFRDIRLKNAINLTTANSVVPLWHKVSCLLSFCLLSMTILYIDPYFLFIIICIYSMNIKNKKEWTKREVRCGGVYKWSFVWRSEERSE